MNSTLVKARSLTMWYLSSALKSSDEEDGGDIGCSSVETKAAYGASMNDENQRKAFLKVTILNGENLTARDASGKSDPYCIIRIGSQEERTTVRYKTVDPNWGETFVFKITNLPQLCMAGPSGFSSLKYQVPISPCQLLSYATIDIWDKDTLNRDDFMGRIFIPLAAIPEGTLTKWYSLGRTTFSGNVTGKILISTTLRPLEDDLPIERWAVDKMVRQECEKLPGFQLLIKSGDSIVQIPGPSEHVEVALDDVLAEVSGRMGLARVFLTDFRLIILSKSASSTNIATNTNMSMWVALNNIQSVEKGVVEKVIQRTEAGTAGLTDVKTLTIKCADFRTIRLTFMKTKPANINGESKFVRFEDQEIMLTDVLTSDITEIKIQQGDVLEPEEEYIAPPSPAEDLNEADEENTYSESAYAVMTEPNVIDGMNMVVDGASCSLHRSCMSVILKTFYKRLKYISMNAINYPPSKCIVAFHGDDFILNGWEDYKFDEEFERQGVDDDWRQIRLNGDYSICSSYPRQLYVPSACEDDIVQGSAAFRSKGRIPALSWYNSKTGSFIMRCSQPKTGAMGKYSTDDESLIETARSCVESNTRLVIFDARSMLAAGGNKLKGKGTEDVTNRYTGCKLLFLDIANIHAMRDSIDKLQSVCELASEHKWLSQLESTQWLNHIRSVLKGATLVAHYVNDKAVPVLIHCSDGWDRTPQLTSLAQLMLDPYYRTFEGFKVLIDKEWVSFGHRFKDRVRDPGCPSQRSPVFLQFIECTWQILQQYPNAFEFGPVYLTVIAEHINSGWFGNFVCNSLRDRELDSVMRTTVSLWAHLDAIKDTLLNPTYQAINEAVLPVCSLRRLKFWSDYYLRYDGLAFTSVAEALEELEEQRDPEDILSPTNTVIWIPDDRVRECHDCKQKFTGIRRKHHCRACGQIFCSGCTRHRIRLPFLGYMSQERVCDVCFLSVSKGLAEEDDFEVIGDQSTMVHPSCFPLT